jgi:hypothetical protein
VRGSRQKVKYPVLSLWQEGDIVGELYKMTSDDLDSHRGFV